MYPSFTCDPYMTPLTSVVAPQASGYSLTGLRKAHCSGSFAQLCVAWDVVLSQIVLWFAKLVLLCYMCGVQRATPSLQLPEMLAVLTEVGSAECWHKKSTFKVGCSKPQQAP